MNQGNSQIQVQSQQQVQQQVLTPQQVLVARLMEMPIDALQQRVENECMENPWLERKQEEGSDTPAEDAPMDMGAEDDAAYDYRTEDDIPDYMLRTGNGSSTGMLESMEYANTQSFYDKLKDQMAEYDLTPHEQELLEYLIGSLEDDGLLKKPLTTIMDEAEIYHGLQTNMQELERMLHILWQFDPPGLGARSLQECLLLQVGRDKDNPLRNEMKMVLTKCYDDFIHNRWDRIQERMQLSELHTEELRREIMKLNPKPGASLNESSDSVTQQVTPDFLVDTDAYGNITLTLNQGNVPELVISNDATEKLESYERNKDKGLSKSMQEDIRFTKQYVDRGQMFILALAKRRETLMRTMEAIVNWQRPFFLDGNEDSLRPMRLEDVADRTGYDISTVSRACNGKYVQTVFGIFPIKRFFTRKATTGDGEEDATTTHQVMTLLREMIQNEAPSDRLSDERLAQMMRDRGLSIARRTIAKYRDAMGIPSARMRI